MFSNNDRISIYQMVNILVLTLIGVGALTLPRELVQLVETDAIILLIMGGTLTMGIAFIHGYIVKSFPGKSYFEILSFTVTKPIAYLFSLFFIVYLVGTNGLLLRILVEVVKVFMLPRTPMTIIAIMMLMVVAYSSRFGIEPLGRITNILFPGIVIFVVIMFALSFYETDFTNLLPIFQTPPSQLIAGLDLVIFSFLGFEIILIFGALLDKPEKATRIMPLAIFIVLLYYLLIHVSVISNFGMYGTKQLIWPTLTVFDAVDLPGAFIENVQVIIMSIWVYSIFMTLAPLHIAATMLLGQVLKAKELNYLGLPLIPVTYYISQYSGSVANVYVDLGKFTDYTAYFIIFGMPVAILIGMLIRKAAKKSL
ncbi:spore germination protein [Alkaliphilus metalliredigens QYMF]|uniref:Spore germination protein n=1 Tax=Alkaliphilus metalliredigens (strain QYMF) TaxID=293826 RepID=A6TWV0_ALKMQ|nr:endospore germination permease [Alkaliphilus metalliredigens]ABR50668.1 spore germination protein [Alkaliphilus metalliredigens QYMF]